MTKDMTREGGKAVYNKDCEQHGWGGYVLLGGIGIFLVGSVAAVGMKIASDSDEIPAPAPASIEDYAQYTGERMDSMPLPVPAGPESRAELVRNLEYAEELVFFDGSPETVQACKDAVEALSAVSAIPVTGNCTP